MNFSQYRQISKIILLAAFFIVAAFLILDGLATKGSDYRTVMATGEGALVGYRISKPLDLGEIRKVISSEIKWDGDEPAETSIIIETAVTNSSTEPPENWQSADNYGQIPGIKEGEDLMGKFLWTKQTLTSNNEEVTPWLKNLEEMIEGYAVTDGRRVSPEFSVSRQGDIIRDSRIFWEARDEGIDGVVSVIVDVYAEGTQWSWKEWGVISGGSIPGLEPGTSLSGARIKTKISFEGGPNFYPSLENIKIFIETE